MGKLLKNVSDADLEKELERRRTVVSKAPTPLDNPDFTKLRAMVIAGVDETVKDQHEDDDFEHYVYEAAMEAVFGKGFWEWRNKQKW